MTTLPTNDKQVTHGPESAAADSGNFDMWAIVELMGHRKLAGRVSEQIIAGTPLLRIDVPDTPGCQGFTTYYGASAIYSLTPTAEQICIAYAAAHRERPIQAYELKQLAASGTRDLYEDEDQ
jgi:hypothetical protein